MLKSALSRLRGRGHWKVWSYQGTEFTTEAALLADVFNEGYPKGSQELLISVSDHPALVLEESHEEEEVAQLIFMMHRELTLSSDRSAQRNQMHLLESCSSMLTALKKVREVLV